MLSANSKAPNVIIFYADDMGVADVSYRDAKAKIQTLNIDRLASERWNLQVGQNLVIEAEPYHWDFLNLVAEEACKKGAAYVLVEANDPRLLKARVEYGDEKDLDKLVGWTEKRNRCIIDEGRAKLSLF